MADQPILTFDVAGLAGATVTAWCTDIHSRRFGLPLTFACTPDLTVFNDRPVIDRTQPGVPEGYEIGRTANARLINGTVIVDVVPLEKRDG